MALVDSFKKVYDKGSACFCTETANHCEIKEYADNASFHTLRVVNANSKINVFDSAFIKKQPATTNSISSFLEDKNCDGTIFINGQTEGEHIVFAELKSSYNVTKLDSGFKQLIHSLLKYHRLMSLCDNYDLDSSTIDMVLACNAPQQEDKENNAMRISSLQMLDKNFKEKGFESDIFPALEKSDNNSIVFKLGQLKRISSMPIDNKLKRKQIILHMVTSSTTENSAEIVFPY